MHIVLFCLTGCLLFAGYFSIHLYKKSYIKNCRTELDPIGLNIQNEILNNVPAVKSKLRLLLLGDSRAASWNLHALNKEYEIINLGIKGQTTAQILLRSEYLMTISPDIVLIQAGINDLKTIPLFSGEYEQITRNCIGNINDIVNHCLQNETKVIVSTLFPVGKPSLIRRVIWSDLVKESVREVNDSICGIKKEKLYIFDSFSMLAGSNGILNTDFEQDVLHINQSGYSVLNENFIPFLAAIMKKD